MTKRSVSSTLPAAGLLAGLLSIALLAGCKPQADGAGPAEQAGKAIDDAGARVAGQVREQVDKADAAAAQAREQAREATAQAREQAREATAQASRNLDKATDAVGRKVEQAGEKIQQAAH
jgi:hypothetical protein